MGDSHELGQSRSAEDGMIGSLEVGNLELDVLGAVALFSPDGNWQNHLSEGYSRIAWDDAIERRVGLGEHASNIEAHRLQSLGEQSIESAATVNEYFGELRAYDYRVQD